MKLHPAILFAIMAVVLVLIATFQSANVALNIINLCLISAIMALVRVAPIRLSVKVLHVSDPWLAARMRPPITPKAAASVAVARPIYIDPMTTRIRQITGIRNREFRTRSAIVIGGSSFGFQDRDTKEVIAT